MNLKINIDIDTEIAIKSVKDLCKLKIFIKINNLDKPNFSELGKSLGVDRRTAKKYYEGIEKKKRKQRISKIYEYQDIISSLLLADNNQVLYYKSHLYRYFVRAHGLECSRNNCNYY